MYLVLDMCHGGTLADLVLMHGPVPERKAAALFRAVLKSLAHCHSLGIVHRDVKCARFLCALYLEELWGSARGDGVAIDRKFQGAEHYLAAHRRLTPFAIAGQRTFC